MRQIPALALLAALAAGCGGSDAGDPTTISVTVPSTRSPQTTTTAAEQPAGAGGDEPSGQTPKPEPGSGSGAASPVEAAAAVLTSDGTVEQACGSFVTESFIQSSYGGEQNCVAARAGGKLASTISVGPSADEQSTHLVVIPAGGPYDGARVEVDLVSDRQGFRVDALNAHVPAGP